MAAMLPSARHRITPDMEDMMASHPSLAESLEDFEHEDIQSSPAFGLPSQHSGFAAESESEQESTGRWSPPAWHKDPSGWFPPTRFATDSRSASRISRESSVPFQSAYDRARSTTSGDILGLASGIPLPASPERQMESPRSTTEPEGDTTLVQSSPARQQSAEQEDAQDSSRESSTAPENAKQKNCKCHKRRQHRLRP